MKRLVIALGLLVSILSIVAWRLRPSQTASSPPATKHPSRTSTHAARSEPPLRVAWASVEGEAERASLEGRVVDAHTGAPVAQAQISFLHDGTAVSTSGGSDGNFRLILPDPGRYLLESVTAPGYLPYSSAQGEIVLSARDKMRVRDLELFLEPQGKNAPALIGESEEPDAGDGAQAGRLRGVVHDANGRPATAFSIVVWQELGALERGPALRRIFFDLGGRFEIDGLSPGNYRITAVARDAAPAAEERVRVDEIAEVSLRLGRAGRLSGRVLDGESKKPIAGAKVELEGNLGSDDSPLPLLAAAFTGSDGAFSLSGLGRGPFSLATGAPGHHGRLTSGLTLDEGGEGAPLTIELTPTGPGEAPRLELVGIGAVLSGQGDALVIVSVMPSGGAAEASLGAGDQIVSIDGVAVTEIGFAAAIERIRGPEGSTVLLRVRRSGAESDVAVSRRKIRA
jgi:protocatechuate 3,4-dioxygenase beta subunit